MPALRAFATELLLLATPVLVLRTTRSASLRGRAGERLAARYLRSLGHRVLARNLRHPSAELDLVTATRTHLVLVEVKTGTAGSRPLSGRFGARARARQRQAVAGIARRHGLLPRLDLIEVRISSRGAPVELHHTTGL